MSNSVTNYCNYFLSLGSIGTARNIAMLFMHTEV